MNLYPFAFSFFTIFPVLMSNTDETSAVAERMSGTDSGSVATRSDGITEIRPLEKVTAETNSKFSKTSRSSRNEKEMSGKLSRDSAERRVCPSPANLTQADEGVLGTDVYPGEGTLENPFVVDWDRDDPENPYNWPKRSRWLLTCQVCNQTKPLVCETLTFTKLGGIGDTLCNIWVIGVYRRASPS